MAYGGKARNRQHDRPEDPARLEPRQPSAQPEEPEDPQDPEQVGPVARRLRSGLALLLALANGCLVAGMAKETPRSREIEITYVARVAALPGAAHRIEMWLPVDASEARKNPGQRDYFFGALDEDRVQFSIGRDAKLPLSRPGLVSRAGHLDRFTVTLPHCTGARSPNLPADHPSRPGTPATPPRTPFQPPQRLQARISATAAAIAGVSKPTMSSAGGKTIRAASPGSSFSMPPPRGCPSSSQLSLRKGCSQAANSRAAACGSRTRTGAAEFSSAWPPMA
jgi:hypothetical protein